MNFAFAGRHHFSLEPNSRRSSDNDAHPRHSEARAQPATNHNNGIQNTYGQSKVCLGLLSTWCAPLPGYTEDTWVVAMLGCHPGAVLSTVARPKLNSKSGSAQDRRKNPFFFFLNKGTFQSQTLHKCFFFCRLFH